MKIIDAEYVRTHLTGERGEKVALADAMGVKPDVVAKIVSGVRRVQPNEMPIIEAFFEGRPLDVDPLTKKLNDRIAQLTDEEKRFVLGSLDGLIAQRQEED